MVNLLEVYGKYNSECKAVTALNYFEHGVDI